MKKIESIKELRRICQGPVKLNTFYERIMARKLSIYVTKIFLYTNISANGVSFIMLFVGIIASILFGFGDYIYSLLGVLLLQFWYVLDHTDGEVARYRKKVSKKGLFIDLINHHIVHPFIFIFIGIGLYRNLNDSAILLVGTFIVFFLLLQDLINFDRIKSREIKKEEVRYLGFKETLGFKGGLFKKVTQIIYKFPGIMNIITIAAIFNQFYLVFLFYGITFPIMVLLKIIYNLRVPEDKF